jgi:hypothetical protein
MLNAKLYAPMNARDKMPLEVTPVYFKLQRYEDATANPPAAPAAGSAPAQPSQPAEQQPAATAPTQPVNGGDPPQPTATGPGPQ